MERNDGCRIDNWELACAMKEESFSDDCTDLYSTVETARKPTYAASSCKFDRKCVLQRKKSGKILLVWTGNRIYWTLTERHYK
jgi:hypothetical protein